MQKKLKSYLMPIAMTVGTLFHPWLAKLGFLTPYLIFIMLFFAYSKLKLNEIHFSRLHVILVSIQILGSLLIFLIIQPFNLTVAQGVMICVLAPTATAAPVITGMLRGNVASLTAYSLISNLSVALTAPIFFSFIGTNQDMPFVESFMLIMKPMFTLLLLPLIMVVILRRLLPRTIGWIGSHSAISFYLWVGALTIVTGRTVDFVMRESDGNYSTSIWIAAGALVVCLFQFITGRRIGREFDDTVAGGQGLGQKNTILAIWMAQTYLNPIASIGPGSYVLWQNLINSYQVWRKRKTL